MNSCKLDLERCWMPSARQQHGRCPGIIPQLPVGIVSPHSLSLQRAHPREGPHSHSHRCTRMGFIPRELHPLPASWILSHFLGIIFHDFTISGRVWNRTQTPLTVTDNPKDPWILYFIFCYFKFLRRPRIPEDSELLQSS